MESNLTAFYTRSLPRKRQAFERSYALVLLHEFAIFWRNKNPQLSVTSGGQATCFIDVLEVYSQQSC